MYIQAISHYFYVLDRCWLLYGQHSWNILQNIICVTQRKSNEFGM